MRPKPASQSYSILRRQSDSCSTDDDSVTVEEPLEIRVNGESIAVTMRTPGDDEELAAGFCLTEGIVCSGDDIAGIEFCANSEEDNIIDVRVDDDDRRRAIERSRRASFVSSSCGICGKQTLDRIEQSVEPFEASSFTISHRKLGGLPSAMRRKQTVFSRTGGLHSAALFAADAGFLVLREDVGRHNAVDKVIGSRLLQRLDGHRERSILLVSGRASFEIVQKAAVARIPFVAAVSAPSSLAVDLARRLDMTLVGFLRRSRLNIYSGEARIQDA